MQVYILMQTAGPFGQAAQNADERRRRDGEGEAPSLRELAKPSGFDGRSFFRTQKGSGSRFWEPLLAVISGVFVAQSLSTGASRPEPRWTGCKR